MERFSKHDEALIEKARHLPWEFLSDLRDQCESKEAGNVIWAMEISLYHRAHD